VKFVSLFAGAGGFDLGLERAGHQCVGQCEIDPHARAVLERHWPDVPKHEDVTTIRASTFAHPELVTFGSPCQDLSVAGKRAGLEDGTRSGLFYEAVRYIREIQEATHGELPKLALWENVPGAYSSNGGADFATVLALLVGGDVRVPAGGWPNAGVAFGPLGSAEWRTLDSQHFGVAQRRRRVFLVYRAGGERAGEVLLEPDGVRGHSAARDEARPGTAARAGGGLAAGSGDVITALTGGLGSGGPDAAHAQAGWLVPVAPSVLASWGHHGYSSPRGDGTDPIVPVTFKVRGGKEGGGKGYLGSEDKALTISTVQEQYLAQPVAFAENSRAELRLEGGDGQRTGAVNTGGGKPGQVIPTIATPYAVRRLTPRECERLQAFPDDWTRYRPDNTELADTHRYRLMGNAVTVNVIEWIGRRLA
jgi:DNA (cytosine-5)-methyltransferase 1